MPDNGELGDLEEVADTEAGLFDYSFFTWTLSSI